MGKTLVEMAADIVQSQSSSTGMNVEEITLSLQSIYEKLQSLQQNEVQRNEDVHEVLPEAVGISPEKSILKNKIICMECGQEFKMLSPKHLSTHDLTTRDYRKKYGFKLRQPLCCRALSAERKKAGKKRGIPENLKKAIEGKKKRSAAKATKSTTNKKTLAKAKK